MEQGAQPARRLTELNGLVRDRLQKARDLANLDREQELTGQIGAALKDYFKEFEKRDSVPPSVRADFDFAANSSKQFCHALQAIGFLVDQLLRAEKIAFALT